MISDKAFGTVLVALGAICFAYYTFWIIVSVRLRRLLIHLDSRCRFARCPSNLIRQVPAIDFSPHHVPKTAIL
jgi:hypothetical protein